MKRLIVGALTSALLLLIFPSVSNAAVTPGAKCSKAGVKEVYKGKTFTCVKSGAKLVWSKGVKVEVYDAAFARSHLSVEQQRANQILADAKSSAERISSAPYCVTSNSSASASIGGDESTGLRALIFENFGICDITVRASAAFRCDSPLPPSRNTVTGTGVFPLRAKEKLIVSYNISRYFPQVLSDCRLLTGISSNLVNISRDGQSPSVMTLTSSYSGEFNQAEASKRAENLLKTARTQAEKIVSDAKNPVMIAKAWKALADKALADKALADKALADKVAADKVVADTLAVTCVVGGSCKVGNTGPGGGVVFYDAGIEQPWGRFLEFAPEGWYGSASDPRVKWCDLFSWTVIGPRGTSIGQGKHNTNLMLQNCTSGAAVAAATYRGGAKDDWFLPSKDELNELVKFVSRVDKDNPITYFTTIKVIRGGFTEGNDDGYYSSTDYPGRSGHYAYGVKFGMQTRFGMGKYDGELVRPIRAFSIADAQTAAQAATNKNCFPDPKCSIGSYGPGGGIVFYDAGSQQSWGRYLEFAPEGWSGRAMDPENIWCDLHFTLLGNIVSYEMASGTMMAGSQIGKGKSNTDIIVSKCSRGAGVQARSYTGGGKLDWSLPSIDELEQLCKYASNQHDAQTAAELANLKVGCRSNPQVYCDGPGSTFNKIWCWTTSQRGGFTEDYYWSSSERDERQVWVERVEGGGGFSSPKSGSTNPPHIIRVRPVRAF